MIEGALSTEHPEDQLGKETPVGTVQPPGRQLAIHELIGVTALFLDTEKN
jgi:hypothetical protein